MSIFIAGRSFALPEDFGAAKITVFAASVLSAALGVLFLGWTVRRGDANPQ